MHRTLASISMTIALIACGGSKPAPQTPPDEPPVATDEPAKPGPVTPDEPVKPDEPTKPEEPAPPDPATIEAELLAAETSAWGAAKPVFESYCAGCHTDGGKKASKKKLAHFNFSTYPPGGHHTATIGFTIREVLGQAGKKATMPYGKPGSVKGEDLEKIIAWTNAWEAAEKGGAHPPAAAASKDK